MSVAQKNIEVETAILDVDSKTAAVYLEKNSKNRTLNENRVKKYSEQMLNGQWAMNGEPIIIGSGGELLDGQHRLEAVKRSGAKVKLMFCFNVDPSTFDTIDTGDSRTGADVLSIEGLPPQTSKMLSVCIRLDILMQNTGKPAHSSAHQSKLTPHAISQANKSNDRYLKSVEFISSFPKRNLQISGSALSFLTYRFFEIDEDFSREWLNGLITGVGLSEDDSRLWIRNMLWKDLNASTKRPLRHKMGIIVRAWHKDRNGTVMRHKHNFTRDPLDAFKYIALPTDNIK